MCPFSGEASCPAQEEVKRWKCQNIKIWNVYMIFILLQIAVLFVAMVASQMHDWWLFAAGISTFMLVIRASYAYLRRHPW